MKLLITVCASKFGLLTAFCLSTIALCFPAAADAQEACIRTSAEDIICGELVSNPSSISGACNTIIREGSTLNWMTFINGSQAYQGIITVNAVSSDGNFSATTVNHAFNNTRVDHVGFFNSSNFTLLNPEYNNTWTGVCNQQKRIEGRLNSNPDIVFQIW